MINECLHKNKLVRDGASQSSRINKALDPSYAAIDERSLTDLLAFIKRYAAELNYYDRNNKADGTWEIFFQQNCVCLLSDIAAFDSRKVRYAFNNAAAKISENIDVRRHLKSQFDLLFTLLFEVEKWLRNIDGTLKLYNEIHKEIIAGLSLELLNIISIYKKAGATGLINVTSPADPAFEYPVVSSKDILDNNSFSGYWYRYRDPGTGLAYDNWKDYYNSISLSRIYKPAGSLKERALYSQYFLKKSLDLILSSFARLLKDTDVFLDDMLTNYSYHEPHMGLLLSFLQLFSHARDQINSLTRRHLDFYLEEVLGLKKQEAVADKAFIIFELAKGIDKYRVAKDTSLSAGKDDTGNEVLFYTTGETVFNKAGISELRNIFIDSKNDDRVYASPVANSPDGMGSEFTEDPGRWNPFGEEQASLVTGRTMPDASFGFLIASEALELSEGNRKIKIDIHCNLKLSDISSGFSKAVFNVYISGQKGWIKYTPALLINDEARENRHKNHLVFNQNLIQLLIEVSVDNDPVVALDPAIHDTRFDLGIPAVFVECSHESDRYAYGFLKKTRISRIDIKVSADKAKNLLLQCDQSLLDPSKPFTPFGTIPKTGSSFIVGSKEVLNKKLTKLALYGKWNDFPRETGIAKHYEKYNKSIDHESFTVTAKALFDGLWTSGRSDDKLFEENIKIFGGDKVTNLALTLHDNTDAPLKGASVEKLPAKFDINSRSGFIKIELEDNNGFAFGHQVFPKIYAEQAMEQVIMNMGETNPSVDLPNQPYTPVISDFYIAYTAVTRLDFESLPGGEKSDLHYCQVCPFGYRELLPAADTDDLFLLPRFGHIEGGVIKSHNGELIIGLENTETPASLELLFKVAEGSEDPELPARQVDWFYLKEDQWTRFESAEIVADKTKNLTTTGILSLSVPLLTSLKTRMLKTELLWIMASVTADTNAACDIIEIHPQAALAEFKDNHNNPQRRGTALPAGSIAKLKVKDPNVKAIDQPYASFGGKVKETSGEFYLRTSERLRHKNRGITVWDYERVILQEFPDLYKVKCINHTAYGYYEALGDDMDSEFAPGYVTIIVIPRTFNQNAINPYEPKVNKAQILQIEEVISERITPFAARKLKILNPLYEQIQLELEIEFYKQYSDRGFYEKQLNEDIKKFLSPWAYSEGRDIVIGGRIHKSVLIDFIEELAYVDYLKNVKMNHYINYVPYKPDITTAYPSKARSAFVTVNNTDIRKEHIIKRVG